MKKFLDVVIVMAALLGLSAMAWLFWRLRAHDECWSSMPQAPHASSRPAAFIQGPNGPLFCSSSETGTYLVLECRSLRTVLCP